MKAPGASVEAPRPKWIWATSYPKIALNPIGAASALALIAVWLMEFNWPSAHAWFGKYPVTIGLITGLLNLIFTVSLVNRIIERRDELRWRDIRNTTLKGLNDEVRATRDILWVALFGEPPFGPSQPTSAACGKARDSSVAWSGEHSRDPGTRIWRMEHDAGWTILAAQILRLAVERIREGLVRWAPMMALAHGDYEVLVPITTLADVLEVMEFPFVDKRRNDGKGPVDEEFREALHELWLHAITACVHAEETIVGALYPRREYPERPDQPWRSEEPRKRMLSEDQRTELDQWLESPSTFKKATRNRKYAVTKDVEWPW
jgi:hypothetical protein